MQYLTVVPAYGRDYKSQAEVKAAYKAAKDFEIVSPHSGGRYINIHDKPANVTLSVRYAKLTKVINIK